MTYSELLQTEDWKNKREQIKTRDSYTCQNPLCNKQINPFENLKWIMDLKTYMDKKKFHSYEIDFESNKLKLIGERTEKIEFNYKIENVDEINKHLIVKYDSQCGPLIISSYWVVRNLENIIILNVHHKKYIKGRDPWEYDDEDLITLCQNCHKEVHETEEIPIYNENGIFLNNAQKCDRCNGSGYLPEYKYFQNGVCFKCLGEGAII